MKQQRGFSLLEIMVVIVILGVLGAVVVPNLMGNKDIADQQKAKTDISTLETQLKMYKLQNGRYPTTDQGLEALVTKPDSDPVPRNYPDGGYLERLPKDSWGNDYQYMSPGDNGDYDVFTLGADGQEGGEGINADIGNWNLGDFQ
ncbi:Type II secretion system protein G [Vibrio stylophorae]|uniref:Type II secretion system core protein G n=1 Tax=Vibrio stylophorae TaxID=659351 RepID=A0ABN8DQA2_9VIBR|nr:type II secretion system major pseudopilin GspG [Vibrio stylophorae]CAH0532339.1 Type II secretion system protein G [Vibrio stylophorae]